MTDRYCVIWDKERDGRRGAYYVTHANNVLGHWLRWDERHGEDSAQWAFWSRPERTDDVICAPPAVMGTFDGYAKATAAIVDYPTRGAYA